MSLNASQPAVSSATDPRLAELVDELTARLKAGETLDFDVLQQQYSEYAAELQRLLPTLRLMVDLSNSASRNSEAAASTALLMGPAGGLLGDFQLLREIGRGGMGIVYEAEQISLGRRVALKVLAFAATMDTRHLQRFQNEARAAASLHHTNIVPVYFVGCERGVHFYAMQLIDGRTLAAVIHDLQPASMEAAQEPREGQPTIPYAPAPAAASTAPKAALSTSKPGGDAAYFRKVAEMGVQAAEALDYAHQMGVVHRDIKPGNLMLDGHGTVWITDFGLAQLQTDANLTLTGDLMGTLRYMSPEQALAKRVPIDHRTDIYSLGATLYELLTLRPVIGGNDRQELLSQIAFDEPIRLRRLNRAIPSELEIIVLKTLEKNPADRCSTAAELADDLRLFLEDKPIQARRPSFHQVAAKWFHRHPSILRAAAVIVFMALVALSISVAAISHERDLTQLALNDKTKALDERTVALSREKRAVYSLTIPLADLAWGEGSYQRADRFLDACAPEFRDWEWHHLKRLTGKAVMTLPVTDINGSVSEDDRYFISATGARSNRVTIAKWDLATGQKISEFTSKTIGIVRGSVSRDGKRVAFVKLGQTGAAGNAISVWDLDTGTERTTLPWSRTDTTRQLALSPDGASLTEIRRSVGNIWDVESGKLLRSFPVDNNRIFLLTHGGIAWQYGNDEITGWYVETGAEAFKLLTEHEERPVLSTDGKWLAYKPELSGKPKRGPSSVAIWDVTKKAQTVKIGYGGPAKFSNDNKYLVTWDDGRFLVWEIATGRLVSSTSTATPGAAIAVISEGRRILLSGREQTTLWELPSAEAFVCKPAEFISPASRTGVRPGSSEFATYDDIKGTITISDWATGQVRLHWEDFNLYADKSSALACGMIASLQSRHSWWRWGDAVEPKVPVVEFSPDGRRLATAGVGGTVAKVWDASTGALALTLSGHELLPISIAFSPDGKLLATGSLDDTIKLWDSATGREVATLSGHAGPAYYLRFSPDGKRLLSAAWGRRRGKDNQWLDREGPSQVKLWDLDTRQEIQFPAPLPDFYDVSFSPSGGRLYSTDKSGTVEVWDMAAGKTIPWPDIPPRGVCPTLSANGKRLATVVVDKVKIWDAQTGLELLTLRGSPKKLSGGGLQFTPDGLRLTMMHDFDTLLIWDATPAPEKAQKHP